MKNIYQSSDLGRAVGRNIIDVRQEHSLFTDVCMPLVTYRHDVERGSSAFWLLLDLRQAVQNFNYSKIHNVLGYSNYWYKLNKIKCKYKYQNFVLYHSMKPQNSDFNS